MTLPRQVTESGKEADAALAAINTPPGKTPTPETSQTEDAANIEKLTSEIADLKDQLEKSEHKFKVLQGKYNAEIKPIQEDVKLLNTLKAQNKASEKKVSELQQKVSRLVTQNAQFARENTDLKGELANKNTVVDGEGDIPDITKLLSEEDQQFLESEGITGGAQNVIAKLVHKLTPKNKPAETTEAEPKTSDAPKSLADDFWDGLDDAIENWETINKSTEFNSWLDELAPYSDKTKRAILLDAQDGLDLNTVVKIFKDFMASDSFKPEKTPEEETPESETETKTVNTKDGLESEIEPARSQSADVVITPNTEDDKHKKMLDPKYVFSAAEITEFYAAVTQSKNSLYHTDRKLYDKVDQAIVKADSEGRVKR